MGLCCCRGLDDDSRFHPSSREVAAAAVVVYSALDGNMLWRFFVLLGSHHTVAMTNEMKSEVNLISDVNMGWLCHNDRDRSFWEQLFR